MSLVALVSCYFSFLSSLFEDFLANRNVVIFLKKSYPPKSNPKLISFQSIFVSRTYVKGLESLFQHYVDPLKESKILDETAFKILFPPSLEVLKKTHQELLQRLKKALIKVRDSSCIGTIFLDMAPFFSNFFHFYFLVKEILSHFLIA